jgi:toxin ParE1/3/4
LAWPTPDVPTGICHALVVDCTKGVTVIYAPEADDDLIGIVDYIACDKPGAPRDWLAKIRQACELLATQPGMGGLREGFGVPGCRSFSVGNGVLFFRPVEVGIEVARAIHGSRDKRNLEAATQRPHVGRLTGLRKSRDSELTIQTGNTAAHANSGMFAVANNTGAGVMKSVHRSVPSTLRSRTKTAAGTGKEKTCILGETWYWKKKPK